MDHEDHYMLMLMLKPIASLMRRVELKQQTGSLNGEPVQVMCFKHSAIARRCHGKGVSSVATQRTREVQGVVHVHQPIQVGRAALGSGVGTGRRTSG